MYIQSSFITHYSSFTKMTSPLQLKVKLKRNHNEIVYPTACNNRTIQQIIQLATTEAANQISIISQQKGLIFYNEINKNRTKIQPTEQKNNHKARVSSSNI